MADDKSTSVYQFRSWNLVPELKYFPLELIDLLLEQPHLEADTIPAHAIKNNYLTQKI